jgi:hypothetical protein
MLDTLLATAQMQVPVVVINVAAAMVVVTTVAMVADMANVVKLVTRAVAMATCLETAPKVRNATTAVKVWFVL